jgi:uncharacterized protein
MERLIEFANRAGYRLRGMIHHPDGHPDRHPGRAATDPPPGVVFFHGFTGDRMESHWLFVKCSRALDRAGIASLRFDFWGSGESEGEFQQATLESEIADAEDAVDFMRREGGIDSNRLALLGLSLGGAIATLIAEPVHARALVLWAAVAHLPHLQNLADRYARPLPDGDEFREYAGHRVSYRFLEAADRHDPLAGVARFSGPTLIVHPGRDEYLPLSSPEDYYGASAASVKEKIIIPDADHTFTSVAWETEVIDRSVKWFRKHL